MSFFVHLGRCLSTEHPRAGRLVVCVTTPIRSFAALFAGAGVIETTVRSSMEAGGASAHFDYLAGLPEGTPVSWNNGQSVRIGRLAGTRSIGSSTVLMIQVQDRSAGGLKLSCSLADSVGISVLEGEDEVTLPKTSFKGRPVRGKLPFVSGVFGPAEAFQLISRPSLDCLFVGTKVELLAEAEAEDLAIEVPGVGIRSGSLAELVRPKITGSVQPYRSVVVGATSPHVEAYARQQPHVVIIDGAQTCLRWRHQWRDRPVLIILDRSDPRALDAAGAIQQDVATRSIGEWEPPDDLGLPDGVELLGYFTGSPR
jgi:hypothetical protein